jgi:hypothetical protein
VAIDRGRLAPGEVQVRSAPPHASGPASPPVTVVSWPFHQAARELEPVTVPSVAGRSVREAALALHRRGFRMSLRGMGRVVRTAPAAGESAPPGSSITVWAQ